MSYPLCDICRHPCISERGYDSNPEPCCDDCLDCYLEQEMEEGEDNDDTHESKG